MDDLGEPLYAHSEIVTAMVAELVKRREARIIDRLAEMGFTFSSEPEKLHFAKTRLSIRTYQETPQWREMWLDNEVFVTGWWETVSYEDNQIIAGKHPNECR